MSPLLQNWFEIKRDGSLSQKSSSNWTSRKCVLQPCRRSWQMQQMWIPNSNHDHSGTTAGNVNVLVTSIYKKSLGVQRHWPASEIYQGPKRCLQTSWSNGVQGSALEGCTFNWRDLGQLQPADSCKVSREWCHAKLKKGEQLQTLVYVKDNESTIWV